MVLVKIARRDEINSMTYTNTGLSQITPAKEWYVFEDGTFKDPIALFLLYDLDLSIFSSRLMSEVAWYTRTYFSTAKDLDIQIKVKK